MRVFSIITIGLITALFSPSVEAKEEAVFVEKGFDGCHKAVYGKAIKSAPRGDEPNEVEIGTVAMDRVPVLRRIGFDESTNEFVIKHTGIYRINYFIKAFVEREKLVLKNGSGRLFRERTLDVAVQVNDILRGYQRLQPFSSLGYHSFTGHSALLIPLRKRDRVKLVVVGLPEFPLVNGFGANPFSESGEQVAFVEKNGQCPQEFQPVFYSDIGSRQKRRDVSAYLAISKTERNDD